ncbi:MAG TPA: NAD(P)H-hydrate dehydratase [Tepidisphaeraceae bacterium]|jgi:NAD(P)H-hydrate epimerase|nr:NAD(P)H-hydrate dehydratase [Tepidisphaeraceae bacterium]
MHRIKLPPPLPPRPVDGHKGLFGRVLIVGGSLDMIGAPTLAGAAALRMGSGLVQIAMPVQVLAAALSVVPELIGLSLDESKASTRKLLDAADKADVLAIGPGLGQSRSIGQRLDALFRLDKPMVVDADALNYLASLQRWPKFFAAKAVLTPHPGEMKRLAKLIGRSDVPSDEKGRIAIAAEAATAFGQVVVLKGHRTVVTDAKNVYVNNTGDSSLSKAGAGDVLSGILASLIGQGIDRFAAACAAVHLHGRAGEIAGKRLGRRSVLARDVIEAIAAAIV